LVSGHRSSFQVSVPNKKTLTGSIVGAGALLIKRWRGHFLFFDGQFCGSRRIRAQRAECVRLTREILDANRRNLATITNSRGAFGVGGGSAERQVVVL